MKPSFALNLSHEGIGLLHRTIRGWLLVGEVALDVPDLAEAMGYLRSTALGLEPRGITTKLILPASQILYTTIDAPGPTASKRRAQIRAGLEGMTPYAVDDLVYDWAGTGNLVQVAIVARETLDEAESFATEHRFGPVSFVAIPAAGEFASEPFFGATKASIDLLDGDKVERDQDPVRIVGRAVLPRAETDEPAEAEEIRAAPEEAAADIVHAPAPEAEPAPVVEEPEAPAPVETPAVAADPIVAAEPVADVAPPPAEPAAPAPEPEPPLVIPADDALNDLPHKPVVLEELGDVPPEAPSSARPKLETLSTSVTDPVIEDTPISDTPISAKTSSPFGGKAKGESAKGTAPAEIGAPTFSSRRTLPGANDALGVPKLGAAVPVTSTPPVTKAEEAPSPAKTGAPALGGVSSPTKPRPATMPDAVRTALAAKAAKPPAFKAQKPTIPAKPKANSGEPLTRFIPHKGKPGAAAIEPPAPSTPIPASEQEAMTVFGARGDGVQRGKPRYLGLILTVILLALLAAVALWSTVFLSDNSATGPKTTQTASVAPAKPAAEAAPASSTETSGQTLSATVANPAAPAPAEVAATGTQAAQAWQPQAGLGTPKVDGSNGMALASVDPKVAVPATAPRPEATTLVSDVAPEPAQTPPSLADIAAAKAAAAVAATTAVAQPDTAVAALTPPTAPLGAITAPEVAPATPQANAAPLDPPPEADPALSHVKPKPRPAALGGPITAATAASVQPAQAPVADTSTSAMAPVTTIRPKGRPASLDAAPVAVAQTPPPTPPGILVEPTSPLAIASSIVPKTRPAKFAAVAAATPAAAPLPQSDSTASINQALAAAVAAPQPKVTQASTAMVAAADSKPEPAVDVPQIPVSASVANEATVASAINVNRVNLLGVYGTNSDRRALVRLPNGRILKVQVGDALDGGRVAAIGTDNLYYVKNGQNVQLTMPRG